MTNTEVRVHINSVTQRVNICRAQPGNCPVEPAFGESETPHFSSKQEARDYVAKMNAREHSDNALGTVRKSPTARKRVPAATVHDDGYDPSVTPREKDEKIERLMEEISMLQVNRSYHENKVYEALGVKKIVTRGVRGSRKYSWPYPVSEAREKLQAALAAGDITDYREDSGREALQELQDMDKHVKRREEKILELDRYREEKGWSRFYVVPGGHIHSSMRCSTCNKNGKRTKFSWATELSGQSDEEAVKAHGAVLCTVCYPDAPVQWTNHYELEGERKRNEACKGSGSYNWIKGTTRFGYVSGNGGKCAVCGEWAGATPSRAIRKHKAKK